MAISLRRRLTEDILTTVLLVSAVILVFLVAIRGGPHPLDSSAAKLRWIPGSCF